MTIILHVKLVNIKMPSLGCFATISNWVSAWFNGIRDHMKGKFLVCQTVTTVQTSKTAELRAEKDRNSKVEVGLTEKKEATRTQEIQTDKKEKSKEEKRKISQRQSKGKSQKSKSSNNVSTAACHRLPIPSQRKRRRLPPIQVKIKGRPLPPIPNNNKKTSLPPIANNKKEETPEKMKYIANEEYSDDDDIVFAGDTKKVCTVPQEVEHDDDDDIVFPGINDEKTVPSSKLQNEQNHVIFSTKVSGKEVTSDLERTRSCERSRKSFNSASNHPVEDHKDDDDIIVSGINDKVQDLPQKLEYDDDDDIVFPGINDKVYSHTQPPQYDDDDDIIFSLHASRKDKKPSSLEEKSAPRNRTENPQHARSSCSSSISGAVVFKKKCSLSTPSLTKIDV